MLRLHPCRPLVIPAAVALIPAVWMLGCGPLLKPVELDNESETENQLQLTVNKDVDILLVIDNSGSMGEEQANLAANFGAMIDVLEAFDVDANYRIGVTTTDNGNPWCQAGVSTPEYGRLVMSSCRDRIGDFVFDVKDVQDLACLDICDYDDSELVIAPTTTDEDPNPAPRPWLENIEGQTNLPEGISTAEAFACLGPQGIKGCGFESQLESMEMALRRAQNPEEDSYGFLRSSAVLAVIFITDEVDCSYNPDWVSIFETDGNKVFWTDPGDSFPSSAVCWNAGVACSGDPNNYDSCDPVDFDVNGNFTDDPDAAVLHPLASYIEYVEGLEAEKKTLNPDQEVIVGLIAGVQEDGSIFYSEVGETQPEFQDDFGIGPGCEGENGEAAVPPVRLRDFANNFTPDNIFSVCSNDYTGPLEVIADRVRDQIQPACYEKCAADSDPETELLEPDCIVEEYPPGAGDPLLIPECVREAGAYAQDPASGDYVMPDDANVCHAVLVDAAELTASEYDDMSPECIEAGLNLEFRIARRPGFPAASGAEVRATCELSTQPAIDCPGG